MTKALTQNVLNERLNARRQQRDREVQDIIDRAPAPQPGDADHLAELIEKDRRDVAEIHGRIQQRLQRHADEQHLGAIRARHDELRQEVDARQKWQDAFGSIENLDQKLERLLEGAVARSYFPDTDLALFDKNAEIAHTYLVARGWIDVSYNPALYRLNELTKGPIEACNRQLTIDAEPLAEALNRYALGDDPPPPVSDGELDQAVETLSVRLQELPAIDLRLAKMAKIATAALTLFPNRPALNATFVQAQAVLQNELPKLCPEIEQRLQHVVAAARLAALGNKVKSENHA